MRRPRLKWIISYFSLSEGGRKQGAAHIRPLLFAAGRSEAGKWRTLPPTCTVSSRIQRLAV